MSLPQRVLFTPRLPQIPLQQKAVQGLFCFLVELILAVLTGRMIEPVLECHEQVRAVIQVPIHERGAQDKSLEKFLHVKFYRPQQRQTSARIAGSCLDGYIRQVRRTLAAVLALLYPQRCLGCKVLVGPEESFCAACRRFIRPIESPLCQRCGAPFATFSGPDHLCGRCQAHPPAFRRARAWACYQSGQDSPQPLSEAIQHFKYHRSLCTGKSLARLGAAHFPLESRDYDLIVPVPLHPERLRWRGFNQSLILSRAIGRAQKIAVDPFLLERTRPTVPQTQLNETERRTNVRGAFAVVAPERLKGKRVLLVDDVYTSGATVEECAKALSRGDAEEVDVFTLARAVAH